jgi:hypothetical protein
LHTVRGNVIVLAIAVNREQRMQRALIIIVCGFAAACATVKINHDGTNTITHASEANGKQLADRACKDAGEHSAIDVVTINKDASLPPGTGRQTTTFRCSSDPH